MMAARHKSDLDRKVDNAIVIKNITLQKRYGLVDRER